MDFEKIKKTCLELDQTKKDLQEQSNLLKRITQKIKDLRAKEKTQITMILHYTTESEPQKLDLKN
ncbi:hypothetical protein [Flavobacterium lacustre]|uniref:hypothetical protein n=1 Tax=Flavobacterium lacustre TaxID=3016339 RepID=UPI0022B65DA6|nr:hypothetical protein [Flavobacterium lacustre]